MKKLLATVSAAAVMLLAALYGIVLYNGPRMTVQPHLRSFQAVLPNLPAETTPVQIPEKLPSVAQASKIRNPLKGTSGNLHRGKVYYHYYCVFCHGENGDGHGPVGQSYLPTPADLRSVKINNYQDGQLLRAMLTGIGHEPVLERVVPPQHRWFVVLYVRSLP
ncbi:MAG TPA: hypothetical protein VGJ93_01960 [Desulfuromonadaceae bacterium]|jgi:cytochrome c1